MKRFISFLCVWALVLGCIGDLAPAALAADGGVRASAGSVTYYVSISGKGGNNGLSEDKPLPGLDAVPWNQLLPGDSVLLKKGETFPGTIRMVDVHGEAGNPVTIGAYGTGDAPVIETRGQGIWLQETGSNSYAGNYASAGVLLYDCSYITVEGLNIVNRPDSMKASFQDAPGQQDRDNKSDHSNEKMPCSGVAVAADGKAASEGIVLSNITVQGDSDIEAVITETSSEVTQSNVAKGNTAPVRTCTEASGSYYVSSLRGSDANDGSSPDKAFYSLHKVNELDLQPGAKVYLERGSVFENQYLHIEGSGSAGSPIVIDAYGSSSSGAPCINTNGNGVWYQNFGRNLDNANHVRHGYVSSCVNLYDVEYVEVKNIAMTNGGSYGRTVNNFQYIGEAEVDGGTVPGETGYNSNGNTVGAYNWGGKMSRTGVSAVAQNIGSVDHVYLQNLDIENIYGNVYIKHMNNGGIYFTMAVPANETATGIAKFHDVRIEGCYLKRTSRWGISAGYTAYSYKFGSAQISNAVAEQYGITDLYIGHNYLEEVGGDPITAMYALKPLIEYNVSTRGAREICGTYHNGSAPAYLGGASSGNKGTVAAGIWPWKCKVALFEHNECYDMLNTQNGNGDGQAWDADSGDSTIYQYNYSAENTGGTIMFCAGQAYNSVFRYNISYKDGTTNAGPIDMAGNPNGQIINNTFVMASGQRLHYRTSAPAQIENNIFYNLGAAYDPNWRQNTRVTFHNNIYHGFSTKPDNDSKAIVMAKEETLFSGDVTGAPVGPKMSGKNGVGTVDGIRSWSHDWSRDFNMFQLDEGVEKAINAGVPYSFVGLSQDADFGVAQAPLEKDFYGNALDGTPDIGAFDTQTVQEPAPSGDNELKASLFELRGGNELHVPFTENNPTSVEDFKKGLTVADSASVKVFHGDSEVTTGNVAADMTVRIVAENGSESAAYTIVQKNTYNSYNDWVNNQQGNVWFYQYRENDRLFNHTIFGGYQDWNSNKSYASVERNQACGSTSEERGSGFTFRAPAGGNVELRLNYYTVKTDGASPAGENKVKKRASTPSSSMTYYLRIYINGEEQTGKTTIVPKDATEVTVNPMEFTVDQGDTISVLIVNEGPFTNNGGNQGVYFNPLVTYQNTAYTPGADTKAPTVPGSVTVKGITTNSATVTWTASTDNRGVDHYLVSVNGGAEETVTELKKELSDLTPNTEYTVSIKAVDEAGNKSEAAEVTFRTAKEKDTTPPAAPTGGTAGNSTSTTATIRWEAASDNVGVEYYEVSVNGKTVEVRNVTEVTLTGLKAGTSYTASVVAVDAAGNRSSALSIPFTTGAPDTEPPAAVTGLTALGISRDTATVRWTPATDNVGVMGYKVKLGVDGEEIDVGGVLQYRFTGLEGYTEYTASVCAYDEAGNCSTWAACTFTTTGSGECELISSLFEIRNTNQLQVPYTDLNPITVEELAAGMEISEGASVKVLGTDGNEVSEGNVTVGMTVKIVAQDGTVNSTVYSVVQKNTYNHFDDWVQIDGRHQQGNVWFVQYRKADGFHNWESARWNSSGWYSDDANGYASAQQVGACDDVRVTAQKTYQGSGFTFQAPSAGMTEVTFAGETKMRNAGCTTNPFTTSIVVYKNGIEAARKTMPKNVTPQTMPTLKFAVQQGDFLQFMVLNEGATATGGQGGVQFNPVVTYLNEEYKPDPESVTLNKSSTALSTNVEASKTVQLTAAVLPAEADQSVTWESTNTAVATVDQNGLVTAVGNGTAAIIVTANRGWGDPLTASCGITVATQITGITILKDGAPVGSTPVKVYANENHEGHDHNHSVTLTAEIEPENASNKTLNWTRPDGAQGMISVVRSDNGASAVISAVTGETNVGEVNVEVASAADSTVKTTFKVQVFRILENNVTITGDARVGETLTVNRNQLVMTDAGKAALTIQWKRDGAPIAGADEQSYELKPEDCGCVISVDVTADPATFYEGTRSASIEGTVAKQTGPAAPEGLNAVQCTAGDDGKITGLNADRYYEYSNDGGTAWIAVDAGATEITGLAAGDYQVRYAATDTQEAGAAVTKTILAADVTGYDIRFNVSPAGGGAIRVNRNPAEEGHTITVTVVPNPGYQLVEGSLSVAHTDDSTQTVELTDNTFTMPAAGVTISAEFEKLTFVLTHDLINIDCDQAEHNHEVSYGDKPVIHLTAREGYTMPSTVTVTKTDSGEAFSGYTYSHKAATPDEAEITFDQGITEDLTIKGEGVVKTYAVNYTLRNGLTAPEVGAPRTAVHKSAYTGTLVAENPSQYKLPLGIQITMGGVAFTDFDYDGESGVITIPAGKITGNLVITAEGLDATVPVHPVTGVTLDRASATMQVGESITLIAVVAPENATNPSVVWSSSNETVATVDENGKVTGAAEGTAVITVTTVDGSRTDTCEVIVTGSAPTPPSSSGSGSSSRPSTTTTTETREDGTKVTTVTQSDGTVKQTLERPDGTKTESVTTPKGDKTITVVSPEGEEIAKVELPAVIPTPETRFEDVPEGHWADEAIHSMAALEVVSGVGNGRYDMNSPTTRGTLATVLSRLSNGKEGLESSFDDVASGQWYASGIAWAVKSGIVAGYSETEFGPEDPITREQLAVMLCRYAHLLGMDTTADSAALDAFSDGAGTHDWAADSVAWCVSNGILQGKGNAVLDPTATATRAEVAVMLQRLINLMK